MSLARNEAHTPLGVLRRLTPGVALAAAISLAAFLLDPLVKKMSGGALPLPPMVIALVIGIALNPVAAHPVFNAGLTWTVKTLLRVAIALLGLKVSLGDITALGLAPVLIIIASMTATLCSGFLFARLLSCQQGYGALAGAATAVCGASAALASATVVPDYRAKAADIAFTVVAANGLSTLVMLLYPGLCATLGFDPHLTAIMLGATIHDVAQVAGAGYAVSESVGTTAVIVKLFRVFLLLPVVLAIGWWFMRQGERTGQARVPVPVFAIVFLLLALANSAMAHVPALLPLYGSAKALLGQVSSWGLLLAIAAIGLGTSARTILAIGWRHIAVFTGTTLVLLVLVTGGLKAFS